MINCGLSTSRLVYGRVIERKFAPDNVLSARRLHLQQFQCVSSSVAGKYVYIYIYITNLYVAEITDMISLPLSL